MRDVEMDLLAKIHDKLDSMDCRLEAVEKQMRTLIQDVDTVHKFQRSFAERLHGVEKFCLETPLRSTNMPGEPPGNGGGG